MKSDGPQDTAAKGRTRFEAQWHERFVEFATLREDDAGIAGWSPSGLETRFRFFRRHWRGDGNGNGGRYLDVGCGAATYTRWLAENGLSVIGVDYSQPTLIKARARTPTSIPLCAGDATRLPFADASFDGALCFGLLQAVSDAQPVATELGRILKQGGELWIDALNAGGLAARTERARLRLKGKQMHLRYDVPRDIIRVLAASGFVDVTLHWLPLLPSRLRWLQPFAESRFTAAFFSAMPPAAALCSHAFLIHARRSTAAATRADV
jgi:ubiquinone/menaquinone biosynthesis C-methylase UbiE